MKQKIDFKSIVAIFATSTLFACTQDVMDSLSIRHGGYALSAVNEYQGLWPEKITGVTNPYLNTLGLQTRGDEPC